MSYKTTKTVDIRPSVHKHTIVGNRLRRQLLLFSSKVASFVARIERMSRTMGANKIVRINFCLWLLIDFQWNRSATAAAGAVEVAARAWIVPTAPRHAKRREKRVDALKFAASLNRISHRANEVLRHKLLPDSVLSTCVAIIALRLITAYLSMSKEK